MTILIAFYEEHVDKIYNYCFWRVGNRENAQDITSEAFLRFSRNKGLEKQYPKAYLYMITRNLIIDHHRSKQYQEVSLETLMDQGYDPEDKSHTNHIFELSQLYGELQALPKDQQEAIILRYLQDLDTASICSILRKTEASVKSLIYRGLETIRKRVNT